MASGCTFRGSGKIEIRARGRDRGWNKTAEGSLSYQTSRQNWSHLSDSVTSTFPSWRLLKQKGFHYFTLKFFIFICSVCVYTLVNKKTTPLEFFWEGSLIEYFNASLDILYLFLYWFWWIVINFVLTSLLTKYSMGLSLDFFFNTLLGNGYPGV